MKKIIFAILLAVLVCPENLFADFTIDGGYTFDRNEKYPTLGLNLDLSQHRIVNSINYSIGYRLSFNENGVYSSAPGMLGAFIFAAAFSEDNATDDTSSDDSVDEGENSTSAILAMTGIILMVIPENVTFHFWLFPNLDLALGLHPWGAEYDGIDEKLYYTNGMSLSMNYLIDTTVILAPYADFRYVYSANRPVLFAGLRIGMSF